MIPSKDLTSSPAHLVGGPVEDARERELIEAFIRGETAGFKFVYGRFRQRVMSYCVYYMSDQALAEDAFQEVFSRVYTRRDQLRETKALKSWILLITRSVCLNMLRTSKFTPEFVSIGSADEVENMGKTLETSHEPSDILIADDMLKTALARIAPIYREAFLLREFEGYDYDEIARQTETTEMNVKVRITRAKKQLRELLTPYYRYEAEQSKRRSRSRAPSRNRSEVQERSEPIGDTAAIDDMKEDFTTESEEVYAQ